MDISVRKLQSDQTSSFDTEYIDQNMFARLSQQIDMLYPTDKSFHLLDVGGGNGLYADKILTQYPKAQVTLLEPENSLLIKNIENPRKKLICSVFQDMDINEKYDIIQFNWVLHHFVGDSYNASIQLQQQALEKSFKHLSPNGIVVVFENFYEGIWVRNLPSALIYQSTSSKLLAPITSLMGANTAGVGVCFNNRSTWHEMMLDAGFVAVLHVPFYEFGNLGLLKTRLLHLKKQNVGLLIGKNFENNSL
ncbi:class I SAM-dependent methyltransferase [Vibrio sp. DW001]|uniref:class I SAM-dependent methyltransferase n=1 Tax=Vibrio sp. DW001 TaxID=2912315 RepID=UPI0023B00213|nr:class I SAM-dependent methyltransferase [Vibrio sp. DW001]WED29576.1 class I SAM-dependent methyltransferase [Vibrio sp. DW001]